MNRLAFMVAGLCLCGAAVAQDTATPTSVEGSNTGVVIKKTQVKSLTSNYQLLVVPVKGHNIAEGDATDDGILLSSMLPPATYSGMTVTIVSCPDTQIAAGTAYNASGSAWDQNPTLPAGTIFWLSPTATNYNLETLADTDAPIVFCGNTNDAAVAAPSSPGVVALGNGSSEPITVASIEGASVGDQIFRISSSSADYTIYECTATSDSAGPTWIKYAKNEQGFTVRVNGGDDLIPAAEAFYIYNRN